MTFSPPALADSLTIISHTFSLVKYFFEVFLKNFSFSSFFPSVPLTLGVSRFPRLAYFSIFPPSLSRGGRQIFFSCFIFRRFTQILVPTYKIFLLQPPTNRSDPLDGSQKKCYTLPIETHKFHKLQGAAYAAIHSFLFSFLSPFVPRPMGLRQRLPSRASCGRGCSALLRPRRLHAPPLSGLFPSIFLGLSPAHGAYADRNGTRAHL